jgi:ribosomal protein S5
LVSSEVAKVILGLAGVKDLWMRSYGLNKNPHHTHVQSLTALKKTYNLITTTDMGEVNVTTETEECKCLVVVRVRGHS